ncbi:MAG TPA: hypothetical protein VK934_02930 [Fimbriimonas sp.]|nr:hypothetical protein [Fimbriimonas sp.]
MPAQTVHCITDIAHEFSFYFDGRFGSQYVESAGGADSRNWATVSKIDLSNANLFVAQQGATPSPWTRADVTALSRYVKAGGGLLIIGSWALFRDEKDYKLNALAQEFGATILPNGTGDKAVGVSTFKAGEVSYYPSNLISLTTPSDWTVLVKDQNDGTLMASREFGKGRVVVASRGLFGRNPDFSDPINKDWIPSVLKWAAAHKDVSALPAPVATPPEITYNDSGLLVQYNDYTAGSAKAIADWFFKCYREVGQVTGVVPSDGMLLNLQLLATDGGGFSNGRTIGIGAYWGGFPKDKYGMVELIGHEMTHSWVHPFPEPMWNEGLATYIGIQIAKRLGFKDQADASLASYLRNSQANDGTGKTDLNGESNHPVRMGKPMYVFEELKKKFGKDVVARYFRMKRLLITPERGRYTADDAVAVLSRAVGMDLFPRFKEIGTSVDWSKTDVQATGLRVWRP